MHRVGARFALADEVAGHQPGESPEQVVEGARLRGRERAQGREVLHPPPLDEIGGEGPGRAAEPEQRGAGREGRADVPKGGDHLRRHLSGIGLGQGRDRRRGPDGLRHHRTGVEVEVEAEGGDRAHDVGEHDRRVEGKAAERLQGDLGRELRLARELLEAVAPAELPVLGEVAAGLAHDPERPARYRLARNGAREEAVAGRSGPTGRSGRSRRPPRARSGGRAQFRRVLRRPRGPGGPGGRVRVSGLVQAAGALAHRAQTGRPNRAGRGGDGGRMPCRLRTVTATSPGAHPGSDR